jgi:hypothetical protein
MRYQAEVGALVRAGMLGLRSNFFACATPEMSCGKKKSLRRWIAATNRNQACKATLWSRVQNVYADQRAATPSSEEAEARATPA